MSAIEGAAAAVVRAWTIPGGAPEVHVQARNHLFLAWPALATAIERLADEIRAGAHTDTRVQLDEIAERWRVGPWTLPPGMSPDSSEKGA